MLTAVPLQLRSNFRGLIERTGKRSCLRKAAHQMAALPSEKAISASPMSSTPESVDVASEMTWKLTGGCLCASKTAGRALTVSGDGQMYCHPHKDLSNLVQIPPNPSLSLSPDRTKILQLTRPPPYPPISELARPEEKLAGLKIDGNAFSRSRMGYYTDMSIVDVDQVVPAPDELTHKFSGLPPNMWINSVAYSRHGTRLAFTIRSPGGPEDPPRSASQLWVADLGTLEARPVLKDSPCQLNSIFHTYQWLDEDTIVACCLPAGLKHKPERPLAPDGPVVLDNSEAKQAQSYTYQDLLKDEYDEDLFEYYCTSQLVVIDIPSGKELHRSLPGLYTAFASSPDAKFLIVSQMERPFSFSVPCGRFPKRVQIWKRDLSFVKELAHLPLADDIPTDFDSVRKGPRSIRWRPDKDSTVCWVETQDGGDAKVEASPRDIVYNLDIQPNESLAAPTILATTDLRFAGLSFCDGELALVNERWWNTRRMITTVITPDNPETPGKVLFDRSYEDVYNDPGYPVSCRTERGTYVMAKLDGERKLLLQGPGASPQGTRPFLDVLDIDTGEKERIWQSAAPYYECFSAIFNDQANQIISRDDLTVMLSRETQQDVPQWHLTTFKREGDSQSRIMTQFPHPYPHMKDVHSEIVRYKRKDGVDLTATLYLPVGYDKDKDGPLPCLMWVYPREFKSKDAAGQLTRSPYEFVSLGSMSPKLWLARKYAVFDGPSIPIVGEGENEANDTYIEQLIANAEAAVEEVLRLGVAKKESIAVGGHSYGAFTVANLLAHCPELFACGIGRSGAYNRTLTPFGFQSEQRTLWQASDTYMKMSPFMAADKIKKPMLLIHGKDDTNLGTHTMQSERFYAALKAHGVPCRLVLLPYERHVYEAEESVLHCLHEMDTWLQKYCT